MNDIEFLGEIAKTYNLSNGEPLKIYMEGTTFCIRFLATIYSGDSMKEVIDGVKESFAELFLDHIQREK